MKAPSFKKDALFSIAVSIAPTLVGLVSIPFIIRNMGLERFAFLSLIWALAGYFGILDLGLGRSLSKRSAHRHATSQYDLLSQEISFGLLVISALSVLIAILLNILGFSFLESFAHITPQIRPEAATALTAVAISLPFLMLNSTVKGVLEGLHAFKEANFLQILNGLANFLVPWIVSTFRPDLFSSILYLSIFRVIICIFSFYLLFLKIPITARLKLDSTLLFDGGWLTLSAIASPIMVYLDRFILTTMIPLKTLAFYTTPVDLASRLTIIPQAISRVSFPTFSYFEGKEEQIKKSFEQSLDLMILSCLPAFVFVNFFAGEILHYWISQEMAENSRTVLAILSIGLFWNALGWVSYSFLQATDGTRISAVIALFEIPVYLLFVYWAADRWGYLGAGAVWSARFVMDALIIDFYFLVFRKNFKEQIIKKLKVSVLYTGICLISWLGLQLSSEIRIFWGLCLFLSLTIYIYKKRASLNFLH